MLARQIGELSARLATYARFVEEMVEHSMRAVRENRPGELQVIVEVSERKANETELELEQECTALIAQQDPKARDLRAILMVLQMTNDLERIADHAVNIAEAGLALLQGGGVTLPDRMPRMAEEALRMVDQGIQAFIAEGVDLARKVCVNDSIVDDLGTAVLKETIVSMARDPSSIERSLLVLKIAGNLERIADLSTNICEDVIYLVEGRVIKHHKVEDPR